MDDEIVKSDPYNSFHVAARIALHGKKAVRIANGDTAGAYNPAAHRAVLNYFMESTGRTVASWTRAAGVSQSGLRNFLQGRSNTLTCETLCHLAAAADVPPARLLP